MPHSFFDHTGDIGVRVAATTLDDLFRDAAAAFTETVADPARIEPRRSISLTLESSALDLLLVDWLNEILYRFDVDRYLVATAEVHVRTKAAAFALHATLGGEQFDPARHAVKVLIKGVTYHALEVRQDADLWHATVVFDI